jgi:5-formyltetrahydrofolate cyclo-ligase
MNPATASPTNPLKSQLRRQLLKQRQSLPRTTWREKSDRLCQRLRSLSLVENAQTILAYFSVRQEPDIQPLLTDPALASRRWGFSRCVDTSLIWHFWTPGAPLIPGQYGIPEPAAEAEILEPSEVDLILIPAVAGDSRGYRLGYGAGFYDRLLSLPDWSGIPTVGILFDFAYLPELPTDPWDQKLSAICTETRTILY